MKTNLKVILSAVSVAALLASPAMAKTVRHHAAPATAYVPSDARAIEGGPYTPSAPIARGFNRDFQDPSSQFLGTFPGRP